MLNDFCSQVKKPLLTLLQLLVLLEIDPLEQPSPHDGQQSGNSRHERVPSGCGGVLLIDDVHQLAQPSQRSPLDLNVSELETGR